MLKEKLKNKRIILASASPRRRDLLSAIIDDFEVKPLHVEEKFPANLKAEEIAMYLSRLKADSWRFSDNNNREIVITADTIVWFEGRLLSKPADFNEAVEMLSELSGNMHRVYTGVTLRSSEKEHTFHVETRVWFRQLTQEEINWYVTRFEPYDKAGAYGGQEWIGHVAIEKIEGCFFNVVGLPLPALYLELEKFCN
ncbi:MAG: Maf-like protein [Bacteroidales bacterium]